MKPVHGGDILKKAREYAIPPENILDFSSNTNPLGPPPGLMDFIKDHLSLLRFYPDQELDELRSAIGDYLGVEKERIIVTNGASELIYLLSNHLLNSPALIPSPTFSEYEYSMRSAGKMVIPFQLREEEGFEISPDKLIEEFPSSGSLFICNPNNPTGWMLGYDEILRIIEEAGKKGVMVVLDEAFIEFDPEAISASLAGERFENLFVIRSMTKIFSIPGLRLGYGVGPRAIIERLHLLKPSWNINIIAQLVAMKIIKDRDFILKTRDFIPREREFLYNELKKIEGLLPYPSFSNFLLVRLPPSLSSGLITKRLGRRGIVVRDCSSFESLGEGFIRIGVRRREDNLRILDSLRGELMDEG